MRRRFESQSCRPKDETRSSDAAVQFTPVTTLAICVVWQRTKRNVGSKRRGERVYGAHGRIRRPRECARNGYIWKKEQAREKAQYLVNWAARTTPLPLFPALVTGDDLTLNMKTIILSHALDIDVPKRSHWCQNPCASNLIVWKFVEVERDREAGFGNHPGGAEVARFTISPYDRLDFGRTGVRDVDNLEKALPGAHNGVSRIGRWTRRKLRTALDLRQVLVISA